MKSLFKNKQIFSKNNWRGSRRWRNGFRGS